MVKIRIQTDQRIWVNDDRTILVTQWGNEMTVALRDAPYETWGPPVTVKEEL